MTDPSVAERVSTFVADLGGLDAVRQLSQVEILAARYDAGLAWVHHPEGLGGYDGDRTDQALVEAALVEAGVPEPDPYRNPLGTGTIIPTLLRHSPRELCEQLFKQAWTGEEIWCQLFSEPGAGSDLAGLACRAVPETRDGVPGWLINGQKVWTSYAHRAKWGLLLTRSSPELPKHHGITVFVIDMEQNGVETRPLRQATGGAEFNEVFFTDAWVPDSHRVGAVDDGWNVTRTTLMHERMAIGGRSGGRETGRIGGLAKQWRDNPDLHTPVMADRVVDAWIDVEVARIANERIRQLAKRGQPGLEGSGAKVVFADVNQKAGRVLAQMDPSQALLFDDWEDELQYSELRCVTFSYLRARANSIEGGTTQVLLTQIADRVLGLPREHAISRDTPWKDIPR
ncbi:acyl-CoA dehydrogenase family protein [Enemella sp. A6]|uniref:acyl-CoA dehydrogenase family protein n=1 Tax=Enemella sp. A6 TaxID=3440152 RepID=UPI003EB71BED